MCVRLNSDGGRHLLRPSLSPHLPFSSSRAGLRGPPGEGVWPGNSLLCVLSELCGHYGILCVIGETVLYCGFSFRPGRLPGSGALVGSVGGGADPSAGAGTG